MIIGFTNSDATLELDFSKYVQALVDEFMIFKLYFRFRTKLRQEYFVNVLTENQTELYGLPIGDDEPISQKCTLKEYEDFYLITGFILLAGTLLLYIFLCEKRSRPHHPMSI